MKRIVSLVAAGAFGLVLGANSPVFAGSSGGADKFSTECSACHMAYQPFFLPKRSWKAIMGDLSNHFGEDASLDQPSTNAIKKYLYANAADANGRAPRWLNQEPKNSVPMRVTQLSWFRNTHGSRAVSWAKSHASIGSIANCTGCHRGAARGSFEDD